MNDKISKYYNIERIRTPMSRDKLNDLYNEFKSDDDYVNYHVDVIEDTHYKYKITMVNDENKSPIENSDDELTRGFAYMNKEQALDFIEDCVNNNRISSKTKAVMQNGYSKKSIDKYNKLLEKEESEGEIVTEFTKPSFEDVMNNIYVNTYNGSTYHNNDSELPDDLRENIGVIIPGVIETKEEYFEFVKRLKDKGKNGLARAVYDRYEDYEEAKELIEQYKQALFDKYGGKEEYFYAKDIGGIFGAYEYYPTIKPRFKRTARNIKLDKGMNLNELALVKDMGKRIRDEYDDEINQIDVNHDYNIYENTPPKFKDLPDDLNIFYKTDKYGVNGFDHIENFITLDAYAKQLINSGDPDKQIEGYRIVEDIKNELLLNRDYYDSEFVDIVDDNLSVESMISQLEYDKLMYETDNDIEKVESIADDTEIKDGYRKFLTEHLCAINGYDLDKVTDKNIVNDLTQYAANYLYNSNFRKLEEEKSTMNSVAENLYKEKSSISFGSKDDIRNDRSKSRKGDNKITTYVRELASHAKTSLENMNSNADNVNMNYSTISINDAIGYNDSDKYIDGFSLEPTPRELLQYMKNNEKLAKKIYEKSAETEVGDMFSERTNIDDFVDSAKNVSKPMFTKTMIERAMKSNRKGD